MTMLSVVVVAAIAASRDSTIRTSPVAATVPPRISTDLGIGISAAATTTPRIDILESD